MDMGMVKEREKLVLEASAPYENDLPALRKHMAEAVPNTWLAVVRVLNRYPGNNDWAETVLMNGFIKLHFHGEDSLRRYIDKFGVQA